MDITESSMWREVESIIGSEAKPVHYTWSAEIHVEDETYPVLKVHHLDMDDDFENNYCSEITGKMSILGGIYAFRIYPNKDILEMTLYRTPTTEVSGSPDLESQIKATRYRLIVVDKGNPVVEGNTPATVTEDVLNISTITEVDFQLIDRTIDSLRVMEVGGIYRDITPADVVKALLTQRSQEVDVEDEETPLGVDMIPPHNEEVRDHVLIPPGTSLVDAPNYVHQRCGGIYSSGLGYFFSSGHWYIYPCYDNTRVDEERSTLTIYNIPPNKLPNVERTYREDGSSVSIIATSNVRFTDNSEQQLLSEGNGVRFAFADSFLSNKSDESFAKIKDNKASFSRERSNSEFIAESRRDKATIAPISGITSNQYYEMSKLAKRKGSTLAVIWENSNPDLLFPGMMVTFMYLNGEEIRELTGVLLRTHTYIQMRGIGITSTNYTSRTVLVIFSTFPEDLNNA